MSSIDTASRTLTIRRTDSVPAAARVRHVDQLEESAREQFYDLVASDSPSAAVDGTSFVDGEVIVFTDYYRIDVS
ncbi:hypothetical protein [Natrialbaceae archaeon AArc-T1-2]|uniref:hypothetical protein n=1 Tax=Natrialbaceae archaeon AArc-T1-2 TaxID=3053904 RepID=UPI00255ACC85|nr:hypothetical protein [Natrialbaceae archaeon AArc-T1-2]WIV68638.1 hypothetical protein QQ977_07920 [Natrialbaceae archaeon AArc-T1-2]